MKRIRKRGRDFEKYITSQYLENLNSTYLRFFNSYNGSPLLVVNAEDIDFVNNANDYKNLLNKIIYIFISKLIYYSDPFKTIACI